MKTFLTRLGAFLGVISFSVLVACAGHIQYETTHQPPMVSLLRLQDNVVSVRTEVGLCSGWIDKTTHKVFTAAHCFDYHKGDAIVTFNNGEQHLYTTEKVSEDQMDSKTDHAILVQKNHEEIIKYPEGLPICHYKPYYAEPLVEMGNPLGVQQVMYFGSVANPNTPDGIVVDITMFPGNSGGPMIDMNEGCVIGASEMARVAVQDVPLGVNYAAPVDNF